MNHKNKPDLAHAPGHRTIARPVALESDLKLHQESNTAKNRTTEESLIHRKESPQRRIIPGASIEKKGRRE